MIRAICNFKQALVKSKLIIVVIGAGLLPLSTLAATTEEQAANERLTQTKIASTTNNSGTQAAPDIADDLDSNSASNSAMPSSSTSTASAVNNQSSEQGSAIRSSPVNGTGSSNNNTSNNVNGNNGASNSTNNNSSNNVNSNASNSGETMTANTSIANDNATMPSIENSAADANTVTAPNTDVTLQTPAAASATDKMLSSVASNALFIIGGLILLMLGAALLLMQKINGLKDENQVLARENQILQADINRSSSDIAQLKNDKVALQTQLDTEPTALNKHAYDSDAVSPLVEGVSEAPVVEDPVIKNLDASDRTQLADSITTWFKTNRGSTQICDLVPKDIQHKLDHFDYKIELWVGSNGVDAVEPAENTMRAAVISLTKPDHEGFAYCYKKPNALSAVWVNKAWYQIKRNDHTLELLGAPLEIS